jgi:hypothetical protein
MGHIPYLPLRLRPPETILILPSAGLYTTANDMARYLRFHINRGEIDGKRLLSMAWAETMYTPPNTAAWEEGYGLGIGVHSRHGVRCLEHGGGGLGFNTEMIWYPELKLGMVVLTNSENRLYLQLPDEVMDEIITTNPQIYDPRALQSKITAPALPPEHDSEALTESELTQLIKSKSLPIDEHTLPRWQDYAGNYTALTWGLPYNDAEIKADSSGLHLAIPGFHLDIEEIEVEPGVFYDSTGDRLDLRGPRLETFKQPLTYWRLARNYRNITLVKLTPFRVAAKNGLVVVVLGGLITLLVLVFWVLVIPAWLVALRRRAKRAGAAVQAPYPRLGWIWPLSLLAGSCGLVTVLVLNTNPGLRLLPWPAPYLEAGLFWVVALGAPYAGVVVALAAAVMAGLAKKRAVFPLAIMLAMVGFFSLVCW